jgi:hypothetical protein
MNLIDFGTNFLKDIGIVTGSALLLFSPLIGAELYFSAKARRTNRKENR